MPEGDIFQRHNRIAANHACQPAQPFTGDRVAFVRHCRAAFLSFTKEFFHFENLGPLEMTKFSGPAIDARCNHGECGQKLRVPVALHDLRRNRRRLQAKFLANDTLDRRIDMGMRADRAA